MTPQGLPVEGRGKRVEYKVELGDFGWKEFLFVAVGFPLIVSSPLMVFVAIYELIGALS